MENNQSEDINLLAFFRSLINLIIHNKIIFTFLFISFFGLGYFYYFFLKTNEFESSITISSKVLKTEDVKAIVYSIDNYIKGREFEVLSKELNISVNEAMTLVSIKAYELEDPKAKEVKPKEGNEKFFILLRSVDNQIFEKIQPKILNFLKSSDYFKTKVATNRLKHKNLITQYDHLLGQLDTLNPSLFDNYKSLNSKFPSIFLSNPGSLSETIIQLNIEKEKLNELFIFETDLVIIQPFKNFAHVENKTLNKFILVMPILSFLMTIFILGTTVKKRHKS